MKNNKIKFIITVLCVVLISATSFFGGFTLKKVNDNKKSYYNKTEEDSEPNIGNYFYTRYRNISEETADCVNKNWQTDARMQRCYYDGINKYNIELEKILKEFKKFHSQAQYEQLLKSQKYWNEFIKENNKTLKCTLESCFATNPYVYSATIKYEYIEFRIEKLIEYLKINEAYNDKTCK